MHWPELIVNRPSSSSSSTSEACVRPCTGVALKDAAAVLGRNSASLPRCANDTLSSEWMVNTYLQHGTRLFACKP